MIPGKPLSLGKDGSGSASQLFGREWVRAPLQVGAIAPSSIGLSRAITEGLSADGGPVLELGPGTGVFTSALLARGIPAAQIAAIEAGPAFAHALAQRFPGVTIICGDGARIRHLSPFGPAGAAAVVCGLPLLSMPPAKVMRIMAGSFAALRAGGTLRLFTYGPRCPVAPEIRARLGLVARRTAFVALNMPPASVYVLHRPEPGR